MQNLKYKVMTKTYDDARVVANGVLVVDTWSRVFSLVMFAVQLRIQWQVVGGIRNTIFR